MLSPSQADQLYRTFATCSVKAPQYAEWCLKCENCTITRYTSGKTLFQGSDAEVYAAAFMEPDTSIHAHAGSDEVGTGDYFGPVCVCAVFADDAGIALIHKLAVHDSKQIKDEDIRKAAPVLMEQLPHSLLIVPCAKYNQVHERSNLNAIKALLHNQAYVNLRKKIALPKLIVIDQFTPEKSYYRYISSEKEIVRGIHFETKAEDKYPAVGAASVIARYAFLKYMEEMDTRYGMHFPFGASGTVDQAGIAFAEKYGKDRLGEVAKLHFKNTEKIMERL